MNMKKTLMAGAFLCALANFAFAGGGWASDERPVYDGESEVVFTCSGLEGVSARVYQNGTFVGEINTGTSQRRIVTDGSHTFEVRPSIYDSASKQTIGDKTASKTVTVSSRKNRSLVRIVIAKSGGRNVVSELGLTNAVAIQTQPKPQETTPAAQPANKPPPAQAQQISAQDVEIYPQVGRDLWWHSIAYSPDGKWILTGSQYDVRIWDAANRRELKTLITGSFSRVCVSWKPGGKYCVVSTEENIRIYDTETWKIVNRLRGHQATIYDIAYSSDGRRIASSSEDKTIKIWDAETGKEIRTITGQRYFRDMAWKPNTKQLAAVTPDGGIKIWDSETGREISNFTGGTQSVIYSPDGRYLIAGTYGRMSVLDTGTGRIIKSIQSPNQFQEFEPNAYRPDGRQMAAVYITAHSSQRIIVIFDTATWQEIRRIETDNGVPVITYSPDSRQMAIGYDPPSGQSEGRNSFIGIIDANTGRELGSIAWPMLTIDAVTFSPDGNQINAVSGNTVKVWNREDGSLLNLTRSNNGTPIIRSPNGKYFIEEVYSNGYYSRIKDTSTNKTYVTLNGKSASFSPDGKWIITGEQAGAVHIYSAETFAEKARFIAFNDGEWLAMTPDGYYSASAKGDQYLNARVGNTVTGIDRYRSAFNKPAVLAARLSNPARMTHNDAVNSVAVNPGGTRIAAVSQDKLIKLWDLESGRLLRTITNIGGYANAVSFSPDGRRLVHGAEDKTVRIWDAETGAAVRTITGHTDYVNEARYSPDGRRIASCADDKLIKIWDAETGREIRTLAGHTDMVAVVAWSPDGRRIASGSDAVEKTIRIWDVESGRVLQTITGQGGRILALAYSPDGKKIASTALEDKAVKIWDAETGRLIRSISDEDSGSYSLAWSPDGKRLATGDLFEAGSTYSHYFSLWNAETWELISSSKTGTVLSLAFTPDSRRIVATSNYSDLQFIKVYDALTGAEL
jgi:WD40 repeat protein